MFFVYTCSLFAVREQWFKVFRTVVCSTLNDDTSTSINVFDCN